VHRPAAPAPVLIEILLLLQIAALSASVDTNVPLAKLIRTFEAKKDPEILKSEPVKTSPAASSSVRTGHQLFVTVATTAIFSLAMSAIL